MLCFCCKGGIQGTHTHTDAHAHAIKNKRYFKLDGSVQLSTSCAPHVCTGAFLLLNVSEVTHHENRPRHDGAGGDVLDTCSKSDVDSAFFKLKGYFRAVHHIMVNCSFSYKNACLIDKSNTSEGYATDCASGDAPPLLSVSSTTPSLINIQEIVESQER